MAVNIINKYIWVVDTIQRYGRITRDKLNDLWEISPLSDGSPMSRRTFYNYRQGIAETFNIEIEHDASTYEYYIADDNSGQSSRLLNLLLDSASMSGMLSDSHNVSDRIILEEVPSARTYLPTIMEALKDYKRITFSYRAYNRANAVHGILLDPYCVRLYKQLWYVIGFEHKDRKIKTYSLDRMSDVTISPDSFTLPKYFKASEYFKDCYGIMTSKGEAKDIVLRTTPNRAKYLRALPLHHSQHEEIHDDYSLFHYHMFLTNDLVSELLSLGAEIQVIAPPELRTMVKTQLEAALAQY